MTDNTDIWNKLASEFPREIVSWRANSLTKDGDKAMALAYVDARAVMERLDEAVGPENWQDRYEVHGDKTICYLSIRVDDQWLTKADGSGDSAVEEEKGAISGAFKRAAVKFGLGRYLYDMPTPWVPCTTWTDNSGKTRWSKWSADPWDYVKIAAKPSIGPAGGSLPPLATSAAQTHWTAIASALSSCETAAQLKGEWTRHEPVFNLLPEHFQEELKEHYLTILATIKDNGGKIKPEPTQPELTQAQKVALTP